ncbi:MAG: hypothetical protein NT070_08690 [Cyanobacteria bacterium]|nr:hypothetical protein [Cyanobacteriota bacterium]
MNVRDVRTFEAILDDLKPACWEDIIPTWAAVLCQPEAIGGKLYTDHLHYILAKHGRQHEDLFYNPRFNPHTKAYYEEKNRDSQSFVRDCRESGDRR